MKSKNSNVDFHKNKLSQNALEKILLHSPELKHLSFYVFVSEIFSSRQANSRLLVRKEILNKLSELGFFTENELLQSGWHNKISDLNFIPTKITIAQKTIYTSVSHCPTLGGFVLCSVPIGFDLEVASRLKPLTVARISTQEEMQRFSKYFYWLWPAKESAFKALSPLDQELKTLSQIQIHQTNCPTNTDSCSFSVVDREITGIVVPLNSQTLLAVSKKS